MLMAAARFVITFTEPVTGEILQIVLSFRG